MKAWIFPVLVVLFLPLNAHAVAGSTGFFRLADSGPEVITLEGKKLHLGAPFQDWVSHVSIESISNDNEKNYIHVDNYPTETWKIALCTEGRCATFVSGDIGEHTLSKSQAEHFATTLGIIYRKREDPKYSMQTSVLLDKNSYGMNEPILAKFEICNKDSRPISFIVGGRYRGYRDNQFYFTAYDSKGALPDTGNSSNTGGLFSVETIKPDDCYTTREVDLRAWFTIKKPGSYLVHGKYLMEIEHSADFERFTTWEEKIESPFYLTIQ